MEAIEIAWIFEEIAALLEIKGDNPYRIRAYRRGARTLKQFAGDLHTLWETDQLETLPGIGKDLGAKISELLATGESVYLGELRKEVPPSLLTLLMIPEVGPKTVNTCYTHLGITSIEQLEEKARQRELRKLPGLGAKTELKIIKGINLVRSRKGSMPLGSLWPLAREIEQNLLLLPETEKCSLAGGFRRRCDMIDEISIILSTLKPKRVMDLFTGFPVVGKVKAQSANRLVAQTKLGIKVDLWTVTPKEYPLALLWATGSQGHYRRLQERAKTVALNLEGLRLYREGNEKPLAIGSEEDIYSGLGMQYIVPELRENRGEIEAALMGAMPKLLDKKDIKGDFHCHTRWSDGSGEIEEMVLAAKKQGYHYLAITDHSRSLKVARGLSIERLRQQGEEIEVLRGKHPEIRILRGAEVEILADGTLDYPDAVLKELDVVIAAIHSHFKQDRDTITARILKALSNPHVKILAHPTGRILGRREGYQVDLERVIERAAKTKTVLEINASIERLDLTDVWAKRAKDMGVKVAINADAHSAPQLAEVSFGVWVARRAWLEVGDVINAWPWERLQEYFNG